MIFSYRHSIYLVLIVLLAACQPKERFRIISPASSNIDFVNQINDSDSFNILTYEYIYNGGGVAIADFNNDGLADVFFTGNQVPNRLYLNSGDLNFDDITNESGVAAEDKWCAGVSVVDINHDGWDDLYVAVTTNPKSGMRKNLLYVNQGVNENGVPVFKDMADEYGLGDMSHSVNSAFFDYDNDGDLDMILVINKMEDGKTANVYKDREQPSQERVDKLFENKWSEALGHPVFTDVSKQAGIIYDGYSLGVNATDLNQDGLIDIFITNDYLSRDIIYMNNGDGTFTNQSDNYFQHTSYSAMGNDVVDINNDGLPDIVALDMLPENNYRRKTMLMNNNYMNYINNEKYDYQFQFVRNTVQINQGFDPVTGEPVFSDQALLAGVSATDWSWTPLVADFDNDGMRDMIVTNGFPKDVTDRDFVDYNAEFSRIAKKSTLLSKIPSVKIKNYAYRNTDGLRFEDVTESWGIKYASFSNGAAYGDLDNDGDLDYVVNNINDPAFLFENLTNDKDKEQNWLRIKLTGSKFNPDAIGTKIHVYADGKEMYWEHSVNRGYLSSVEGIAHFGLGKISTIDSIQIDWPGNTSQTLYDIKSQQVLTLNVSDARREIKSGDNTNELLFVDKSNVLEDLYEHKERDIIDFNIQPLLPHKLSQYGPGIAVGDINNDGLDDVYLGGSHYEEGTFLIQQADGSFNNQSLFAGAIDSVDHEDMGSLLFDADGDGDLDLYIVSGSNEASANDPIYRDRFYENREGKFYWNEGAIPELLTSGSCVKAADYDQDGDLDLFIGGRMVPFEYPKPTTSYLLINESTDEGVSFRNANDEVPFFNEIGMVTDALWTDYNNDGWVDLILVGEWMPITFIKNNQGKLQDVTASSGVQDKVGWWSSLVSGDFDQDGDIDYLVGNYGENSLFRASDEYPVCVYGADFDNNGGFDLVPTVYLKNSEGLMEEVSYFGRGDLIKQVNKVRAQFKKYSDFGVASIHDVFTPEQLSSSISYKANYLLTSYLENKGDGTFEVTPLPVECQVAPVFGMLADDFDQDGKPEVLMIGNDFGAEVLQGRMDAMKGIMLEYMPSGEFNVKKLSQSGFYVPGDAKAISYLLSNDGQYTVLSSRNRDHLKVHELKGGAGGTLELEPNDYQVIIEMEDGSQLLREYYYGHTFLSQASRNILIPEKAKTVKVKSYSGDERIIQ